MTQLPHLPSPATATSPEHDTLNNHTATLDSTPRSSTQDPESNFASATATSPEHDTLNNHTATLDSTPRSATQDPESNFASGFLTLTNPTHSQAYKLNTILLTMKG
ncbi:hypothetical protein ElyMa_006615400 [Elysia marginata]|uniref:Uncharacterized protein n=1 Tax=Elysia marginata TaxID=1093978 RepID=A0AAV4IKF4_9GAST|nr:hypothetical protein ElyMa_006615400 [Elysia marginata]